MKKFIRVCMLLAALSAMLCVSALAADATITNKVAANSNRSSVVTEGNAEGKFNVSYDRAAKGGEHLILMVATDLEGGYTITDTSILYINQATASAAGQVDFEVYPSAVKDSVILLTGAAAEPIVLATIDVAGVKVSGTATSWDDSNNTVYKLYSDETDNEDIKEDVKLATPALALSYEVVKGAPTINEDEERYDQTFSFSGVPAGDYKLAIYKPGKYVPKIIEITVASEDVALDEVKLWLYGDVNYDGSANTRDAVQIARFDAGNREFTYEEKSAGDVNGDEEANTRDAVQIARYDAGNSSTMDRIV